MIKAIIAMSVSDHTVLHNLHGHSKDTQFFFFNLKESRLSDY